MMGDIPKAVGDIPTAVRGCVKMVRVRGCATLMGASGVTSETKG